MVPIATNNFFFFFCCGLHYLSPVTIEQYFNYIHSNCYRLVKAIFMSIFLEYYCRQYYLSKISKEIFTEKRKTIKMLKVQEDSMLACKCVLPFTQLRRQYKWVLSKCPTEELVEATPVDFRHLVTTVGVQQWADRRAQYIAALRQ